MRQRKKNAILTGGPNDGHSSGLALPTLALADHFDFRAGCASNGAAERNVPEPRAAAVTNSRELVGTRLAWIARAVAIPPMPN